MPYHGEILNACGVIDVDFSDVDVVAVSGDGPNVCGHLLIHSSGRQGGYYFHVTDIRGNPRYMSDSGYRRYLNESGKAELRRLPVNLPKPTDALNYLEGLMAEKWTWLVLPHNCVAFCEEVIRAGGGTWGSYSNCPTVATAETLSERIARFLAGLQGAIYNAYGVTY